MTQAVPEAGAGLIASHVDAAYYLARNPDVAEAGADPVEHYWHMGWREGRDPNPWFQTDYYLRANPDVRASGRNPLWHFLTQGRREGRSSRPAGGRSWHAELDRLASDTDRPAAWTAAPDAVVLDPDGVRALLAPVCAVARGVAVAFSHDRYPDIRGGTQLLIADEQAKFNGDRVVYLHLSPVETRLSLAPGSPAPQWLHVILDGTPCGIATAGAVTVALDAVPPALPRILIVHALHGHRPERIAAVAQALRPRHAFFWVHDYSAGCASAQLLRNNIAFCHAPPPDSLGCRICVHGGERPAHRARIRALFDAVSFHVVAPSNVALTQWRRATDLPARGFIVHPHARLEPLPSPGDPVADDGPVRVAFVGQAARHKGWETFRALVAAAHDLGDYRFYQFASPPDLIATDAVSAVAAETSPTHPFGMTQALADHRIDIVLALSPWPETFGYVAHEAMAAGADVVALAGTGNIADLVRRLGRGVVLDDTAALTAFFTGRHAAAHARRLRAAPPRRGALVHCGSTATIAPDGGAEPPTTDPDLHLLVDARRLDGPHPGETWTFTLPADGGDNRRTVRLRSRHMRPAWQTASGADARQLGVAVTTLTLDGIPVPPGDPRRGGGWHAPEAEWQWTDGDATVAIGDATVLDVTIVRLARYWRSPLFGPALPIA